MHAHTAGVRVVSHRLKTIPKIKFQLFIFYGFLECAKTPFVANKKSPRIKIVLENIFFFIPFQTKNSPPKKSTCILSIIYAVSVCVYFMYSKYSLYVGKNINISFVFNYSRLILIRAEGEILFCSEKNHFLIFEKYIIFVHLRMKFGLGIFYWKTKSKTAFCKKYGRCRIDRKKYVAASKIFF